jgi:hypothetical protein
LPEFSEKEILMGWFFLAGLVISILLLWYGYGLGFLAVFGTTLLVLIVWGIGRSIRSQRERDRRVDELEKTNRLQSQFTKESDVLCEKLQNNEAVSREAEHHFEQTYKELMPLLRAHSYTFDRHMQETREEAGDFSKQPGVVEICEGMYKHVVAGIARQKAPAVLAHAKETLEHLGTETGATQELLRRWESLYSVLQEKISAGEIASEAVRNYLNQILSVSKELFPLLPDHQIDELQARFSTLTGNLKARAVAQMAKGAVGQA